MKSKLIYILVSLFFVPTLVKAQEDILLVGREIIRIPQQGTKYPHPCLTSGNYIKSYDVTFKTTTQFVSRIGCKVTLLDKNTLSPINILTQSGLTTSLIFILSGNNSIGYGAKIPRIYFDRQGRHEIILEFKIIQINSGTGNSPSFVRRDLITFCERDEIQEDPERVLNNRGTNSQIILSPNPTNRFLNIIGPKLNSIREIRLLTLSGQTILIKNNANLIFKENQHSKIDLGNVEKGMYYIVIRLENGKTSTMIICKE